MKGFGNVFSFTFLQRIKGKGYKSVTILVTMLCFLLPALIMPAIEFFSDSGEYESKISKVYVIDRDAIHAADYSVLNHADPGKFQDLAYETAGDVETAARKAEADGRSVLLVVDRQGERYHLDVLLPEKTELEDKDAEAYQEFISDCFRYILVQKSQLATTQIAELTAPIEVSLRDAGVSGDETDEYALARKIFSQVLPYLNIMILYFMIIAYGQGTANNVIMEKTSKLMDLLLVSVKPQVMLLGKVFATAASAILQLFCWIAALAGGFAAGTYLVRMINPDTGMALIQLFDTFGELSGMFTFSGVALALLMLAAGLLLYCSLAAVGGALAEKPEDLSSTNMLFILVLLFSFFAVMFSGGMDADVPWAAATWQILVPFTAVMITPTKILLGSIPAWEALLSAALVVLAAVAITWIAGKLYKMMSFYRGNLPGLKKLLKMGRQ